jgi:glycosyltransferase involved in cell wall biosynthesis
VGDPVVLHVSNDFRRKGIDYLIETSRLVKAVMPNVRFVVVGADKKNPRLGDLADVEFIGQIGDHVRLARMFRESSVFFLPHRFDRSPHVLVEAMSAGLPLVVSRQGGAIELVETTDTGVLVEVGDIEGYSQAICEILTAPERASSMGQRGKDLVRSYYNWPGIADRICASMSHGIRDVLVQ